MNKAAFMGRNGTIHTLPKGGLLNVATCRALEGVGPALNILGQNGYILSVVTNEKGPQPGGIDYLHIVGFIENWIRKMVYNPIFFQYCYHHHAKKCDCRLPKSGLIEVLKLKHDIDLSESVMFASNKHEVTAAEVAHIGTIVRVNTGKADWNGEMNKYPLYESLKEAVLEVING